MRQCLRKGLRKGDRKSGMGRENASRSTRVQHSILRQSQQSAVSYQQSANPAGSNLKSPVNPTEASYSNQFLASRSCHALQLVTVSLLTDDCQTLHPSSLPSAFCLLPSALQQLTANNQQLLSSNQQLLSPSLPQRLYALPRKSDRQHYQAHTKWLHSQRYRRLHPPQVPAQPHSALL